MIFKERERKMKRTMLGMTLALALVALVLAGCGGGSSSSSSESSTTPGSDSQSSGSGGKAGFDISEEQRSCLKEKGVELPEFNGGEPPEGFEPPPGGEAPEGGLQGNSKAFGECGVETPEFKGGPGGEGGAPNMNSAAFKKQVEKYVACVKENGYELAEPNFSGEGPIFEKAESESASFKEASASCQSLLGGPGESQAG
jgi:hypothetical protein